MSGDIVEHLVANAWKRQLEMPVSTHHLLHRAADEIERLTKERDGWQATAAGLAQDISNADDEIERLRAEASRSCIDCASGVPRQRNEPGEVVVSCRGPLRGNAFMMPFFCSRWEARRER